MKAHATYRMRECVERAMDIHGGKGIIEGEKNYLAPMYQSVPIGITVEGANILTRNLMIFGQGAIRAHPYMLKELMALSEKDEARGLKDFDTHFWAHVGHALKNAGRTFLRGWTGGLAAPAPKGAAFTSHWRQLSRYASAFALIADLSLLTLGGALKRKEMLSARLGDILSELYLLGATLKRFEVEGRPEADKPLVEYIMQKGYNRMGLAFEGVLDNLPARWAAVLTRALAFPLGVPYQEPADELTSEVAAILMRPSSQRDRLTPDVYLGEGRAEHPVKDLELAFELVCAVAPVEKRMREAGQRDPAGAREAGLISEAEFTQLAEAKAAVDKVVAVDAFPMRDVSPIASQHDRPDGNASGDGARREAAE